MRKSRTGKVFRIDLARTFEIAKAPEFFSLEFEGEGDAAMGTKKLIDEAL